MSRRLKKGGCATCGGSCIETMRDDVILDELMGRMSGGDFAKLLIRKSKQNEMSGGEMYGNGWFSDLIRTIGNILPFVAPMLNVVPIIGPLLSSAAYGLSSAGIVGSEVIDRAEKIKEGKYSDAFSVPTIGSIAKNVASSAKNTGKNILDVLKPKSSNDDMTILPHLPNMNMKNPLYEIGIPEHELRKPHILKQIQQQVDMPTQSKFIGKGKRTYTPAEKRRNIEKMKRVRSYIR